MTLMHLDESLVRSFSWRNTDKFICLDTETTGLKPGYDEVLSLAIVDQDGSELFNHLIRPEKRRRWPKATEVNGITWQDVKDESTLKDHSAEIEQILASADLIVGYNLEYDLSMLRAGGIVIPARETFDLMDSFAKAYGEWAEWKNDYKWMKLAECATHYGYEFEAHDALNDAKATAYCYKQFIAECRDEKERLDDCKPENGARLTTDGVSSRHKLSKESIIVTIMEFVAAFVLLGLVIFLFVSGYIWSILILIAIGAAVFAQKK